MVSRQGVQQSLIKRCSRLLRQTCFKPFVTVTRLPDDDDRKPFPVAADERLYGWSHGSQELSKHSRCNFEFLHKGIVVVVFVFFAEMKPSKRDHFWTKPVGANNNRENRF